MKRVLVKISSVILVAALMLPLLCTAAFAALDDGNENSVQVETAIFKEIDGEWTRVDSVCGGDNVKARVFLTTDFTSKAVDLTLFYDNAFFHDSYTVEKHDLAFNPDNPLVASQNMAGDFVKTGSVAKDSFPLIDLVGSDFYDTHNYFQISIIPQAVPFFEYDGSKWLFEFDLTVRQDATGEGDIFVSEDTLCNSRQTEFHGLNFVKGTHNGAQAAMPRWLAAFSVEPSIELKSNPVSREADIRFETKLFCREPDGNDWFETDTVSPGETVKARVYLDTSYPAAQGQFMLFYDKHFFADTYGDQMINIGNSGTSFNSAAGTDAGDTGVTGEVITNASSTLAANRLMNNGLIDRSVFDENNYMLIVFRFDNNTLSRHLDSAGQTEWFVELELTVLGEATGSGDFFTLKDSFYSPATEMSKRYGYGDIHKYDEGQTLTGSMLSMSYWYADLSLHSNPVYIKGEARDISVNHSEITVDKGKSTTLRAEILPEDANEQTVSWQSSDPSVAYVNENGVVTGVSRGEAVITATPTYNPNNVSATCTVTVLSPVTSVTLTPESASIATGDTLELNAEVLPADTTSGSLIWSSSNTAVATVDLDGVVTAVAPGTAIITVRPKYNPYLVMDQCAVTVVRSAEGIDVSFPAGSLLVGKTAPLTVAFTPADTSNKNISCRSSNTAVATVDSNGVVTGVSEGTATITVTTEDGSFTDTCTVTVVAIKVDVSPADSSVEIGKTVTLTAAVTPADLSDKSVVWSSSNTAVATVNANGVVTGVSEGTAVITATAKNGAKDTCTVTVTAAVTPITVQLSVSEATIKYKKGDLRLTATTSPLSEVTWTSSDSKIASVSQSGVVTARDMGTAIITATAADGSVATCKVTVTMTFWQRIVRWFKILFRTWNTAMSIIY